MAGSMSVQQVQDLVNGLQQQLQSARTPEELTRVQGAITAARAQLQTELSADSAVLNQHREEQARQDALYAQQQQKQYSDRAQEAFARAEAVRPDQAADVAGIERLNELLRIIQGRQMVSRNPELEQSVAGPLRAIQTRLQALHVPDDAIAPMLSTLQQRNIEPERAAAIFMTMRAAITNESEVPREHLNEIAAGLTTAQLESGLTPQQIQEAFKYYLALPNTTPANAQALLSVYANRLADLASTRGVEVSALTAEDLTTVRSALKADYDHFVEKTEGDGAIAALLASAVTARADRAEVWTQYRFFDEQQGVDSAQAAVLTAGMMARATDVSQLPQMRQDVMQNYRDILAMRPPESMAGTTLSPFVAAGYAGAGLGPRATETRVIRESHGPSFGELMLWSWFLSSHPTYSTGSYGGYTTSYSTSTYGSRLPSAPVSGTGLPSAPRTPTFSPVSRIGSTTSFATRASTGMGAIGQERAQLGAGVGRNTTILSPTGGKTLAAPSIQRPAGSGSGIVTVGQARQNLGAGVGRRTTIAPSGSTAPSGSSYTTAPSRSPSFPSSTSTGIGRTGPSSTGVSG